MGAWLGRIGAGLDGEGVVRTMGRGHTDEGVVNESEGRAGKFSSRGSGWAGLGIGGRG
jgi:hypothetical protein